MSPFNPFESGAASGDDNRLARLSYGMAFPLWLPFLAAAGAGVAFWSMSRWMRGDFAATLPGAVKAASTAAAPSAPIAADLTAIGAIDAPISTPANANTPAAEPDLAPGKIGRVENYMAHTPPPVEAGASAHRG
jgi:hypothetical protein